MTKNTLTLRSFDIPSIHKFGIGFDSMFDELNRLHSLQSNTNYPPYNVVQITEDEYMISLAVAGFGLDNLSVTKDKNFNPSFPRHSVASQIWYRFRFNV